MEHFFPKFRWRQKKNYQKRNTFFLPNKRSSPEMEHFVSSMAERNWALIIA